MTIAITGDKFDFIVVVGGTAGNVVAGRLAENPNVSILVIEAGPGCLNYYTWVPGSAATFDDWAEFGGDSWNWKGVEKYLTKPVKYFDDDNLYSPELKKVASDQGLLPIEHAELLPEMAPFRDALTKAWVSKGQKLTDDIYSGTMAGLVHCMNSIHKGFRSSSYVFVEGKPNITILSSTHSKKLLFDGTTVTGVEAIGPDGQELTLYANYEVIVSSGVFESPKLLMLSGVGPEEILKEHKIKPVLKSAHVGKNLLDHTIVPFTTIHISAMTVHVG